MISPGNDLSSLAYAFRTDIASFSLSGTKKGLPCGAFHQGAERDALMLAKNEVSIPVAVNGAVGHFLMPLFDRQLLR